VRAVPTAKPKGKSLPVVAASTSGGGDRKSSGTLPVYGSLGVLAAYALTVASPAAAEASFVHNGKAGFVVAHIEYALARDASETGVCPEGMTQGVRREGGLSGYGGGQRPAAAPPQTQGSGAAQPGQQGTGAQSTEEVDRQFIRTISDPNRPNACAKPEEFGPDAGFRTVKVQGARAYGIDMDSRDTRAKGKPAAGTCAHDDLVGMNGERGVDNQLFRVVGCSNSFQSTGQSNTFEIEMHTGSWGILVSLSGVDDIRNDDDVEVGFFANADPIELSANREPLPNATYAIHQDPRFQARTRGRLKDGVLTTDPVDVRFHWVVNSIYLERPLRDARVHMTLSENGALEGYLAGYTPVEAMYNFMYGFRDGKNAKGEPADRRLITVSSMGQAAVLGHTCNGAYYALHELADAHPDPQTGKCTSISTQYRIKAVPAFVVDAQTRSVNDDLARGR
jgi:hypothetical protein